MGELAKVSSFRFAEDTRRQMAELHDAFAPAFGKDSELVRFAIRLAHAVCCGGKVIELGEGLQRLLRTTSFTQVPSAVGGKPGPVKIGQSELGRESLKHQATKRVAMGTDQLGRPDTGRSVFASVISFRRKVGSLWAA